MEEKNIVLPDSNLDSQDGCRPKFRHELKYIHSDAELLMLQSRLKGVMEEDPHADENGIYIIRSIYMDDPFLTFYRQNEDGTSPREKWRIRSYNFSSDRILLECKRKEAGMIQKKSCLLTRDQFENLIDPAGRMMISKDNPPLLNRFMLLKETMAIRPSCIVAYERRPFICRNGNVRVTFDRNISSSTDYDHFFDREMAARPIMPMGTQLLEVKYDEYIPDHIYHAIQTRNMRAVTFSKYYLCKRFNVH